jgi:hypothetical protein
MRLSVRKLLPLLFAFGYGASAQVRIEVSFPAPIHAGPITGRVYITLGPGGQLFGADVDNLQPDTVAAVGNSAAGFPIRSLNDVPAGDYSVKATLCPYTEFHRADGHIIWAHMDQWEGQSPESSPGNLFSDARTVHIDPARPSTVRLPLTQVVPPVAVPADTALVKHVKMQSSLLTKFWGQPIYIGATVLLPKDYDQHPDQRYPAVYHQFHFDPGAPFGYSSSGPRANTGFSKDWNADDFPRAIAVTFQHPTVYYDDSYAANSANNGPYGDALTTELIPYLESHFRMIPEARARTLTGGSTGGWEALALQVYYPDVFGGTWVFCPDSIDFSRYLILDIYSDDNAFVRPGVKPSSDVALASDERPMLRSPEGQTTRTLREQSQMEDALGSKSRSGGQLAGWDSVYGPVGDDGYPEPLWDHKTGKIDKDVANYMKEHGYDLARYIESHWTELAPKLTGKMHFYVGDMDNWFANLAVYRMEILLTKLNAQATFTYGPRQGHMWYPMSSSELVRAMVDTMNGVSRR